MKAVPMNHASPGSSQSFPKRSWAQVSGLPRAPASWAASRLSQSGVKCRKDPVSAMPFAVKRWVNPEQGCVKIGRCYLLLRFTRVDGLLRSDGDVTSCGGLEDREELGSAVVTGKALHSPRLCCCPCLKSGGKPSRGLACTLQ